MVNFCPGCGIKLEKDFNFCPSCGMNLTGEKLSTNKIEQEFRTENVKMIICDNCGEENSESNVVCGDCGVKLTGKVIDKKVSLNKTPQTKSFEKNRPSTIEKKSPKVSVKNEVKVEDKTLDQNKLLLSVGGVIVVIVIILFASGVFDSGTVTNTGQTNFNTQSEGVDLSNITHINELQAKVDKDSTDLVSLLELAHLQNDSRMYEKAIINYKLYLQTKPEDADARIDMGVCYYNLKDYANAINEMTNALKYEPNHQIGHLNLGIVNLSAGNLEKSKEWLLKAVELDPNSEVGKRAQELLQSH
jgi:hypothetical protein